MPRAIIRPVLAWTKTHKRSSLVWWKGLQGTIKRPGFNFSSATKFLNDFLGSKLHKSSDPSFSYI